MAEFTNSPLVDYVQVSPFKTLRSHEIDTITIHIIGNVNGQDKAIPVNIQTLGAEFSRQGKRASSNYGICRNKQTGEAEIGMFVPEAYASWCSSNGQNDQRAITIELEQAGGLSTGCYVPDIIINKLVELLVDICIRNNIKKLIWDDNKFNRINHTNGANMTCHRDFDNKTCPGDYVYYKEREIASRVNNKLQYEREEDINMSRAELVELIKETIGEVLKTKNPNYETINDVPDYWRDDLDKLIELGIIKGESLDDQGNKKINLTRDTIKAVIINKRYNDIDK